MKLTMNIEHADGTESQVPVRPRTQVAYERHFNRRLEDDISMEGLYWLAWHASKITQKFDSWLDTIESVSADVENGDDDDAPLGAGQSSGTSLQPPSNQEQVSRSTP
jgi:hypothetical protein